jgi:hypothetical protein
MVYKRPISGSVFEWSASQECFFCFFLAVPVCCLNVTLDYRIDIRIQGSNYNIFAVKAF